MTIDPRIADITDRIRERSVPTRELYLARIRAKAKRPQNGPMSPAETSRMPSQDAALQSINLS